MKGRAVLELSGKRAIVTAGASGIGLAVARAIVQAGGRVHVCDINEAFLSGLAVSDPSITASMADIGDSAAVDRMFDAAQQELGGLEILVNNAGIAGPTKHLVDVTDAEWHATVNINLTGQFYCARRAVPLIKQAGGGSIVNLSSAAGLFGLPMRSPYVAAKFAVIGLTKTMAMELGEWGIRVNAICPGSVEGDRMERVLAADPPFSASIQGSSGTTTSSIHRCEPSYRPKILQTWWCSSAATSARGSRARRFPSMATQKL